MVVADGEGTTSTGAGEGIDAGAIDAGAGATTSGGGGAIDAGAIEAGAGATATGAEGAIDAGAGGAIVISGGGATITGSSVHAGGATEAAASSHPRSISISVLARARAGSESWLSASNVGTGGDARTSVGTLPLATALFGAMVLGGAGGMLVARGGGGAVVLRTPGADGGPDLIGFTAMPTMSASSRSSVGIRSRMGFALSISEGPDADAGGAIEVVEVGAAGEADVRGRGIDGRALALMPASTSKACSDTSERLVTRNTGEYSRPLHPRSAALPLCSWIETPDTAVYQTHALATETVKLSNDGERR